MVTEYTLRLHSIRFRTNMGASRSEREIPQEILVDVELTLPVSALPKRDLRRDAVDYGARVTDNERPSVNAQGRIQLEQRQANELDSSVGRIL